MTTTGQPDCARAQTIALAGGGVGIVLSLVGLATNPDQFYRSYLMGYLFWVGLALGGLPLMMIHHLTGGAWGLVIRRPLEAGARTLPLMLLLFVPVFLGAHTLYAWARPEAVAIDVVLQHKAPFLNRGFWLVRTLVYFAIWIGL